MKQTILLLLVLGFISSHSLAQKTALNQQLNRTIILAVEHAGMEPSAAYAQYEKAVADSLILSSLKVDTEINLLAKAFKKYWWISDKFIFMNAADAFKSLKAEPEKYNSLHLVTATIIKTTTRYGYTDTKSRDLSGLYFTTSNQHIQNIHLPIKSKYSYADFALLLTRLQYGLDYERKEQDNYTDVKSVKANTDIFGSKTLLLDKKEVTIPLEKLKAIYTIGEVEMTDAKTIEQAILSKDPKYLCLTSRSSGYNGGAGFLIVDPEKGATCLMAFSPDPSEVTEKEFKNFIKQHKIYSKKK